MLLELAFLFSTVLLCLEMRFAMLGMQLLLSFTLLLLQILCNRWVGEKSLVRSRRNSLPILLQTCSLYGGLNHKIFRFLDLLLFGWGLVSYFVSLLCPFLCMASLYSGMAFANSSWLHERLDRRFASIIGNCFLIVGKW